MSSTATVIPLAPACFASPQVLPGADRVDTPRRDRLKRGRGPLRGQEVPLFRDPGAGDPGQPGGLPGVVGKGRLGRRGRRDVVRGRRRRRPGSRAGRRRPRGRRIPEGACGCAAECRPSNLTISSRGTNARAGRPGFRQRQCSRRPRSRRAGQGKGDRETSFHMCFARMIPCFRASTQITRSGWPSCCSPILPRHGECGNDAAGDRQLMELAMERARAAVGARRRADRRGRLP